MMYKIFLIVWISLIMTACSPNSKNKSYDEFFEWELLYSMHNNPLKPIQATDTLTFYPQFIPIKYYGNWRYFHQSKPDCGMIDDSEAYYELKIFPNKIHFYLYEFGGLGYITDYHSFQPYQFTGKIGLQLNDFREIDHRTPIEYRKVQFKLNPQNINQLEFKIYDPKKKKFDSTIFYRCPIEWFEFKNPFR